MAQTTSTEFVEWCAYFELEMNEARPEHYYMAQVAATVAQANVRNPAAVRLEDFMLTFRQPRETSADAATRCAMSKAAWLGLAKRGGKPPPRKGP